MSAPAGRSRALGIAAVLVVGAALVAWLASVAPESAQPSRAEHVPVSTRPTTAEPTTTPTPAGSPGVPTSAPSSTDHAEPHAGEPESGRVRAQHDTATTTTSTTPPAPQETLRKQLRLTSPLDRDLLAEAERLGKGVLSPEIRELLALARGGAPDTALQSFIDTRLAGNLPARMAALRWLAARRQQAAQDGAAPTEPTPATPGVPASLGQGGARRRVTAPTEAR